MKRTLKELADFALGVSRKKFNKLSSKKQHELLAAMAYDCLIRKAFPEFYDRYQELQRWAELDRYEPPSWLSTDESLREFHLFHNSFCPDPLSSDAVRIENAAKLSWEPAFDVSVLVDQIRSPFNAGSVLRIIDNFGFKELIHSTSTLSFNHPQLKKSARGCERWIPVRYEEDPVGFLTKAAVPVIGIEKTADAIDIKDWQPPEKCILVAGNEEYGIAGSILECCTEKIQIPMFGFKKSMNVHHALAVAAHHFISNNP